jgi:hypothetical protein
MYTVTKQFGRGRESTLEKFPRYESAAAFIQAKLAEDIRFKVETTYRIYDDLDELQQVFTHADADSLTSSSGGQSAGRSQSFSPTPFNTKPQPGGLPHSWIKDEDDKDK